MNGGGRSRRAVAPDRSIRIGLAADGGVSVCRIGPGALEGLVDRLRRLDVDAIALVADRRVYRLHGQRVEDALLRVGLPVHPVLVPSGERHKTRETKAAVENRLVRAGVGRRTVVVSLGGGVTTDLAGFVAATWCRGVPVAHVPTSLLAMVDAAIGGKSGVDVPGFKNAVGAFHGPVGVFVDPAFLETLPDRRFEEGLAEVVKTGIVASRSLFGRVERDADGIANRDGAAIVPLVAATVAAKARVVRSDLKDTGRRAVLNFGHTFAHAIEAASGYRVTHGRAVAVGLVREGRLAVRHRGFPEAHLDRVRRALARFGLPESPPRSLDVEALARAAERDKKNVSGNVAFALPSKIGYCEPVDGRSYVTRLDRAEWVEALERPLPRLRPRASR